MTTLKAIFIVLIGSAIQVAIWVALFNLFHKYINKKINNQ